MNGESIHLKITEGIYDIQPPATPVQNSLDIFLQIFIVCIFVAAILFIILKKYYSQKNILKRNIKLLHADFLKNKINDRDFIFQLASLLQNGLQLQNINKHIELPEPISKYKAKWDIFSTKMSDYRYQKTGYDKTKIAGLTQECLFWVHIWP